MKYSLIKKRIAFFRIVSIGLSVLLHPLLMPTLTFAVVFYFCPIAMEVSPKMQNSLLLMVFITTFLFPFLSTFVMIYILKRSISLQDLMMENRKERFYPFLFVGFFYLAITYMFISNSHLPLMMAVIMGGISLSVLLVAVVTYFWKISAHAVGICGVLGYTLIISYYYPYELMLYPVGGVALLAGLLMSARLNLNTHTPSQVFSGGLLGLVTSVLSFILFKTIGFGFLFEYY